MTCKQCINYTFSSRYCSIRRKQMPAWGECADGEPRKVKVS